MLLNSISNIFLDLVTILNVTKCQLCCSGIIAVNHNSAIPYNTERSIYHLQNITCKSNAHLSNLYLYCLKDM